MLCTAIFIRSTLRTAMTQLCLIRSNLHKKSRAWTYPGWHNTELLLHATNTFQKCNIQQSGPYRMAV